MNYCPTLRYRGGVLFFLWLLLVCSPAHAGWFDTEIDTGTVNAINRRAYKYLEELSPATLKLADSALFMAQRLGYEKGQRDALIVRSNMFYKTGDYVKALAENNKLMHASLKTRNSEGLAVAYNLSALIFLVQDNPELALSDLHKAIFYNRRLNNAKRLSANYFNLSMAFDKHGLADSALATIAISQALAQKAKSKNMEAMALNKRGEYLLKAGKTDRAISCFMEVLADQTYRNEWEDAFAYAGLAEAYLIRNDYDTSVKYSGRSLVLAKKLSAKWDISRAYRLLQQAYAKKKLYAQAYTFFCLQRKYEDSLALEDKEKQLAMLQLKQKDIENDALEQENHAESQKVRYGRIILTAVSIIILLLLLYTITVVFALSKNKRLNRVLNENAIVIQRFNEEIRKKNTELEELNQTQKFLLSLISHDLRGPLGSLVTAAGMLKSGDLGKEDESLIMDSFFDKVSNTYNMLENLLLWTTMQDGGIKTIAKPLALPELTGEVIAFYKNLAEDKGIVIQHAKDSLAQVWADPDQTKIMIRNILSNALKFTNKGGNVCLSYQLAEKGVLMKIADDGIGMDQAKIDMLFKTFGSEISTYGTRAESGSGIGLSLVKKFADNNRVAISVTSKPAQGTCFVLRFPVTEN